MVPPDVSGLLPELAIAALLVAAVALDLVAGTEAGARATGSLALVGVLLALALALARWAGGEPWTSFFSGALISDRYAQFVAIAGLSGTAGVCLLALGSPEPGRGGPAAYYGLVLTAALGVLVAAGAASLPVLCLGLALIYVPAQILAGWGSTAACREAALRLAQFSGLAWALLIAGTALVWAGAGAIAYGDVARAAEVGAGSGALLSGLCLALAAAALLAGALPFHLPFLDAHQGAPPPVGGLVAACAAPAAVAAVARLLYLSDAAAPGWGRATAIAAVATVLGGALLAAAQSRLRRLIGALACSHLGVAVLALAARREEGVAAALFLLCVQGMALLGAAGLLQVAGLGPAAAIRDVGGLARRHPGQAAALGVCVLALAGLPPTAGFAGRLLAYRAAMAAELGWPVYLVLGGQLVATWAGVRLLVRALADDGGAEPPAPPSAAPAAVLTLAVAGLVGLGLWPGPLARACRAAAAALM